MSTRLRCPALWVISGLAWLATSTPGAALSQAPNVIEVRVNDPRPLAAAADELERRFGWVTTFEETPIAYAPDFVDVTGTVRKTPGVPVFVARGGDFAFTFRPSREPSDPLEVMRALVEQYNRSPVATGIYGVRESSGRIDIVPLQARDRDGRLQPFQAVLDRSIVLDGGKRNVLAAFEEVTELLKHQGVNAAIFTGGVNLYIQTAAPETQIKGSVREVMMRLLAATRRRATLRMFCQPGYPTCVINMRLLP